MSELFRRNIKIDVESSDKENNYIICTELEDMFHHILLRLNISTERYIIEDTEVSMWRTPLECCKDTASLGDKLVGLKIERGFRKKLASILGGSSGCLNLVEMATVSIPLIFNADIVNKYLTGSISKEEYMELSNQLLKDQCYAFATQHNK